MKWLIYIVGAVAIIFAVTKVRASRMNFAVATNALLAEHLLQHVELFPENPFSKKIKDQIINVWRVSGIPNIKESVVIDSFNSKTRFQQLNVLAMALNELGQQSMLPNEFWHPVANPFDHDIENHAYISAVASRLRSNHGVEIQIPERKFQIKEWGLSDGVV